jgi:hypothetical protein
MTIANIAKIARIAKTKILSGTHRRCGFRLLNSGNFGNLGPPTLVSAIRATSYGEVSP